MVSLELPAFLRSTLSCGPPAVGPEGHTHQLAKCYRLRHLAHGSDASGQEFTTPLHEHKGPSMLPKGGPGQRSGLVKNAQHFGYQGAVDMVQSAGGK